MIVVTDTNRSNIIVELSLRMKEVSVNANWALVEDRGDQIVYIEKTYKDYIINNLPGNSNSQIQYLYNKMTGENYEHGNHGWDYK